MDFDIDSVLDQLEKTLNQSEHEENEANQIIETPTTPSASQKPADELFLLDLDPFGNPENYKNDYNNQDNDNRIERFKQDLQELYASSILIDMPSISTTTLPDVVNQEKETSSTSLPLVVEQLEYEVRQEISQHALQHSSDDANILNGHYEEKTEPVVFSASSTSSEDEEEEQKEKKQEKDNLSCEPVIESTETLTNIKVPHEPDIVQDETSPTYPPVVLHSVDSIVNAPMGSHLNDFIAANSSINDSMALDTSSEGLFTACNDNYNDEKGIQIPTEESTVDSSITSLSLSPSTVLTTDMPTQNFDLIKNVLSEIFDKNDPEIIDEKPTEEKESEIINIEQQEIYPPSISLTTNNEDFRFLDEMLASIDGSDTDIPQLNTAEIDRVDNLLREIINVHEPQTTSLSSLIVHEDEPSSASAIPVRVPSPSEQPPTVSECSISNISEPLVEASAASAAAAPVDEELIRVEQEWAKLTEDQKILGSVAPEWVSDEQAPICMKCSAKFSITRRRHHCRACGKVFCATCCSQKIKLIHDDSKEDRACNDCIRTINHVEYLWNYMRNNQKPRSSVLRKRQGSSATSTATGTTATVKQGLEHKKSVTFDDGVKPGAETNVSTAAAVAATNIMSSYKVRANETDTDQVSLCKPDTLTAEQLEEKLRQLKDPNEPPVELRIHNNLSVVSKIVDNFDCYLNWNAGSHCWIFVTRGLCTVAQDELIYIFDENIENANDIISDLLTHVHQVFIDATKGSFVRHLGLSLSLNSSTFLGSPNAAGFMYLSDHTVSYSLFPEAPFLFGILIHRSEMPTAQCFPMRLLLRLGYEYKSYPWPLFSIINRDTMFSDTQHTIMSLLCDCRTFTYVLPTVRGLAISIGTQGSVSIRIPRNRHDDILKSLEQSSPHALSFGIINVNRQIHSKHLVTMQNSTDQQYKTRLFSSLQANNEQIMIGGNFLVVNASLRSRDSPSSSPLDTQTSGSFSSHNNLNAKVNTIEDGIMLQIDGDVLKVLKQCLRERKDYAILAKARSIVFDEEKDSTSETPTKKMTSEQLVEFLWVDDDNDINRGVRSPIDHFPMDGIRNSRIHYAGQRSSLFRIRWTDLFFIQCHLNNNEVLDPTRLADSLAKAFTQALTSYIDMLIEAKCRKLGLRVTIDRENASYIAGSNGEQLAPFFLSQLDDHMIPIVMKASDNISRTTPSFVLELIFYIID